MGIDVGFSSKRKTTCLCLLEWDKAGLCFRFRLVGSGDNERADAFNDLVEHRRLAGIALDGPLTHELRLVGHYRAAEAILSRGWLQRRGKPGQTSSPTGQMLHQHATKLARLALSSASIDPATHWEAIHEKRIVEAFPNIFLGALIDETLLPVLSRDATDRYWELAVEKSDRLNLLMQFLLPDRRVDNDLAACFDHEQRAGAICALSALAVVMGKHTAVGDAIDGDIVLPPAETWGVDLEGHTPWLEAILRNNVCTVRGSRKAHPNHGVARAVTESGLWFY